MYCKEVSNIVLARSCSINRCRELEKVFTFFQVCVGAPLTADHAHNRERVPLSGNRGKRKRDLIAEKLSLREHCSVLTE